MTLTTGGRQTDLTDLSSVVSDRLSLSLVAASSNIRSKGSRPEMLKKLTGTLGRSGEAG